MPRIQQFALGDTVYGLEVGALREIVGDLELHAVPGGGAFLAGAVNLRGRVLPVIDVPALLGVATAEERGGRLLILSPGFRGMALSVTAIGTVVEAVPRRPPTAEEMARGIAGVVADDDGQQILLLDPGALVRRLEAIYAV